jgi:hypothetical protein
MKMNSVFKSALPHILAVLVFTVISFAYFHPVLEGKRLVANDTKVFNGSAKEIQDYRKETGKEPLWTNSMFGGMPAYLISVKYPGNLVKPVETILKAFGTPAAALFLAFLGFYVLLLLYKTKPWVAFLGALAYGFSSYMFICLSAGHNTKAFAMAYMAPIIGSVVYSFRHDALKGSALMSFFLTLQLMANHIQITYYTFLIILVFGIFELVSQLREHNVKAFIKPVLMLFAGVIIAVGVNFGSIYTTWEYSKYSTRGKSDLKKENAKEQAGLNKAYITQWSYGIDETMTLLIPDFRGGASVPFSNNSETVKALRQNNMSDNVAQFQSYWGDQPGTSGPVYVGAIVIFLFVLGLIIVPAREKWWIIAAIIVSVVLSWGKNLMFITNLFIDYFPGYDKFRAVSVMLVMAGVCIPLLAALAIKEIVENNISRERIFKALKLSALITGGIAFLFFIIPGLAGSFLATDEKGIPSTYDWLKTALIADRKMMLRLDAIRSALLIAAGAAVLWFMLKEKIKPAIAFSALALLVLIDMWPVASRYLSSSNFQVTRDYENSFLPTKADKIILQDKSEHRVLNLTVSTFNDGSTSYLHHSIGGYHGAKMMRYDELISNNLMPEIKSLISKLQKATSLDDVNSVFSKSNCLNMLNAKYVILSPNNAPLVNEYALGNAWFVKNVKMADNANAELSALSLFDPKNEALVDRRFDGKITSKESSSSAGDTIYLENYKPNQLTYKSSSKENRVAVFSEIYYPAGWDAFIDNKKADYFRADYVLRAMSIPAGDHTVIFRFEPSSYKIGNRVSLASSVILLVILLGIAVTPLVKKVKHD